MFIPLTSIAGVHGMNFDSMPEQRRRYSCFIALGGMGIAAALMVIHFVRRRFL